MLRNVPESHRRSPDPVRPIRKKCASSRNTRKPRPPWRRLDDPEIKLVAAAALLTGAALADWLPRARLSKSEAAVPVAACLLRLGLLPVLFLLVAKFLPMTVELQRVMLIQAAMPAAVIPIVLARHYGGDTHVAIQAVVSTCALGLLTIPFCQKIPPPPSQLRASPCPGLLGISAHASI